MIYLWSICSYFRKGRKATLRYSSIAYWCQVLYKGQMCLLPWLRRSVYITARWLDISKKKKKKKKLVGIVSALEINVSPRAHHPPGPSFHARYLDGLFVGIIVPVPQRSAFGNECLSESFPKTTVGAVRHLLRPLGRRSIELGKSHQGSVVVIVWCTHRPIRLWSMTCPFSTTTKTRIGHTIACYPRTTVRYQPGQSQQSRRKREGHSLR